MAVPDPSEIKSDKHSSRMNKRQAVSNDLSKARDDLFAGEFDAYVLKTLIEVKATF